MPGRSIVAKRIAAATLAVLFFAPRGASPAAADALDVRNLDRAVIPTDDFYRFAVGGWLARNPIPADRAAWGSFDELQKQNELRLRAIVEAPQQTDAPIGSLRRKIGDFYAACSDTAQIEENRLGALRPALRRIDALRSKSDMGPIVATSASIGGYNASPAMFGFGSEQDPKDARDVIGGLGQGGLTLPTRDYYLAKDARSRGIRAAYAAYLRTKFRLLGDSMAGAAREAHDVLDIETRLARVSKAPEQLRDPFANYHPMPLASIQRLAPHFTWRRYFKAIGLSPAGAARIDVGQPAFVAGLDNAIVAAPLRQWKSYLRLHVLSAGGTALPSAFRRADFDLFAKTLYGIGKMPPRWRTCTNATSGALGFAVGKIYVQRYFTAQARARARAEIALIKMQLREDIATLPWMGPKSRGAAFRKLARLTTSKVGYPDRWRTYATLPVRRGDFLGDALAAAAYENERDIAKIGKPLDRSEWGMTPQTVNAYYSPSLNEVVIPAAILQPPFFDAKADDAINFGGIGAIIGHEMTHGFDDEGSNFDGDGNLKPWMTAADAKRFHARVGCIVAQADRYWVGGGLHLNGKLVSGEATADVGGTTLAFRALAASLAGKPRPASLDGFTPQQRFYLSWAQVWRSNDRPQAIRAQVLQDPHPISPYRVNATLSDDGGFYRAFAAGPATKMYRSPAQRCTIW